MGVKVNVRPVFVDHDIYISSVLYIVYDHKVIPVNIDRSKLTCELHFRNTIPYLFMTACYDWPETVSGFVTF